MPPWQQQQQNSSYSIEMWKNKFFVILSNKTRDKITACHFPKINISLKISNFFWKKIQEHKFGKKYSSQN
jgi:hypothetical protein